MEVGLYQDWMKPQVAKLFSLQYGVSEKEFSDLIFNFYEQPFQNKKCIRIVALEDEKVIGFQSFFYWPYSYNGNIFNSYQSGNSLVHADYRGNGIFQKLLEYLNIHKDELKIDFLLGFPIDVSIGSLLRNGWKNIFNLQWYVKTINITSLFLSFDFEKFKKVFPNSELFANTDKDYIRIEHSPEFTEWRIGHYDKRNYFSFAFSDGKNKLLLKLKINFRKKFIKELIIGDIITTSYDYSFLHNALAEFQRKIKMSKSITLLSVAINEHCSNQLNDILIGSGFKKIKKQIYFCIKPFNENPLITDKTKWILYRGDIDTW